MSNFNCHSLLPLPTGNANNVDLASIGRTNSVYSEEEEAYIRNVLLVAQQQKEEIVDLIGRCKVALAPHKKLPPDVLRSIFHFSNQIRVKFPLSKRGVGLRLLRITHVCSAWRQLALETPALWSELSIYLSSADRSRHHQRLSSARQWFARAQDMPRSLFIHLTWLDDDDPGSHLLHGIWEQILEFMALYRLRDLKLEYPINQLALKLPDHVLSSIECLHLTTGIDNDTVNRSAKSLFSDFGTLSNLKRLKIRDASNLRGLDNIVRWHQLRTLDIWASEYSGITPSLCLNVLRHCHLLEYCNLSLAKEPSFVSTAVVSGKEKIVIANMHHLSLYFFDGSAASAFLQPLVIPNITKFLLRLAYSEGTRTQLNCDMPALIGIIQRSAGMHQIRRLKIDTSPLLDIGILLEILPSLERISIKSGHLTANAIDRLSSGKLGPRLSDIYLGQMHDAADKILSMVELRHQNATKSSDSEQIESTPCPFNTISIPCTAVNSSGSYRSRIEDLSLECDVDMWLGLSEDEGLEEDSEDEYPEDEHYSENEDYSEDESDYGYAEL
ncbi:hypothetical protein F5887DRAFT_121815 [Amanita rubescens]|nr:hypothetical protein F5887DRAFT_121815 [Amanita rubescens]